MLTLFEYLRQRAFEAVIDGTQDALEFLESQKNFDQSEAAENTLNRRRAAVASQIDGPRKPHAASAAGDSRSINNAKGGEKLPAPRRRGRPRKNTQVEN